MQSTRLVLLVFVSVLTVASCGDDAAPETIRREPTVPATTATSPASPPEDPGAQAPVRETEPPPDVRAVEQWLGRWEATTREGFCLTLRDNGRFELTHRRRNSGAVVIRGRYEIAAAAEGAEVALRPGSINRDRYVSACRKHVERSRRLGRYQVLGRTMHAGMPFTVMLRRREDGTPEMCVDERCQPLRRRS